MTSSTVPQARALGTAAAFVPPGDADALAVILKRLMRDRREVASLQQASSERARRLFTPAQVAKGLSEVLRDRVEGTPR